MAASTEVDVVVIGGGPTGLMAAATLGARGNSVALIERHDGPFGMPRAGHVDAESVRILQSVGAHSVMLDDATPYGDYTWYSGSGDPLFVMNFGERSPSHWYSDYTIYQPNLERGLLDAVARTASSVDLWYGWEAVDVRRSEGSAIVELVAQPRGEAAGAGQPARATVTAKYVLAADGAGSPTRERLGIARHDFEFEAETWLIIDAEILSRWEGEDAGAQYCDPRRPAFETPLGKRHHRWEWSLLPGESEDEFLVPAKAWELLAQRGITPKDVSIVRQQVYRFESRTAERWRDGRILLLGDAAHTMAPFMGQGLCAGLRDAFNLGWKLDLVLRGVASDSLLDSYEAERRPHAQAWADISRAVGAISCTLDPEAARERDEAYARGEVEGPGEFPSLTTGIVSRATSAAVGRLFPQYLVRRGDTLGLFDDVAGCEFTTVLGGGGALEPEPDYLEAIAGLGGGVVDLARPESKHGLHDVDGSYFQFFMRNRVGAVVVRPDRYVYGVAATGAELRRTLAELTAAVVGEPARGVVF